MRPPTSLHENRACSPQNFWPPVQNDFCNSIGQKRTHALQQKRDYSITSSALRKRLVFYEFSDGRFVNGCEAGINVALIVGCNLFCRSEVGVD